MTHGPLDFEREEEDDDALSEASGMPGAAGRAPVGQQAGRPRPVVPGAPRPAQGRSRFTWVLGIAVLLIAISIMLSAIGGGDGEEATPGGPRAGEPLAPFAAPDADSGLWGDANVATKDTTSDQAGNRPACEVRGPDVVNICELYERGAVVLAVFPADAERCRAVMGQFDRLRPAFTGRVTFVAVGSGKNEDDRDDQEAERKPLRGYGFPVAYDADALVSGLYGLASCPQITFARKGGRVRETVHTDLTDAELRRRVEALLR